MEKKRSDQNTIDNPFSRNPIGEQYWDICLYIIHVSKKFNRNVRSSERRR